MPVRDADDLILAELCARAVGHAEPLQRFGSVASARQYRPLYRLVRRYVPIGSTVLDWGAANGHFGYFLTRSEYRSIAFTMSDASMADWVGRPYERVELGTTEDPVSLPFGDAELDAVASVGVLEHVPETNGNEAASLAEIARILLPGGVFLCFHFPNRTSWIDAIAGWVPGKHHHRFRYTRRDIERLVAGAGLELVEVRRYGVLPRNFLRLLPQRTRSSWAFANVWDRLDRLLSKPFAAITQNFLFVARKSAAAESSRDGTTA